MDGGRTDRPDNWPFPTPDPDYYYSPQPTSSAHASWPVMQPFRTLVAFIKRCPWAVVSDPVPRGRSAPDDIYYPSVPRSILHDTAVSFIVKDHTHPDLAEFVISCPFEHVDLVHQLLAPEGSCRQLSVRGTSGRPRSGDQLRSMLLDGTPSIELSLYLAGGSLGGRYLASGRDDEARVASSLGTGGGGNAGGHGNRNVQHAGGKKTSPMNKAADLTVSPPVNRRFAPFLLNEPEVKLSRAAEIVPAPATSLLAPFSPSRPSPLPISLEREGGTSSPASPSPFQATVESAPPSPCLKPEKVEQDDLAAGALDVGVSGGSDGRAEGYDDWGNGGPGGLGEPPRLIYLPPSPGQIQRGEPLNGWLCDPGWFRRGFGELRGGNAESGW